MIWWLFEAFRLATMGIVVVAAALVIVTIRERYETWRDK